MIEFLKKVLGIKEREVLASDFIFNPARDEFVAKVQIENPDNSQVELMLVDRGQREIKNVTVDSNKNIVFIKTNDLELIKASTLIYMVKPSVVQESKSNNNNQQKQNFNNNNNKQKQNNNNQPQKEETETGK